MVSYVVEVESPEQNSIVIIDDPELAHAMYYILLLMWMLIYNIVGGWNNN